MAWTDEDERAWSDLMKRREDNNKEVGRMKIVEALRQMASDIESGESEQWEFNIEYVRGTVPFGYAGLGPVIGKRISVFVKVGEAQ